MPDTCACGCGAAVTPGRRYRRGHWARVAPAEPLGDYLARRSTLAGDPSPNGWANCRLWSGYRNAKGYGVACRDGRLVLAHRLALRSAGRAVPQGMVPDHLCERPSCVNADHLEIVTPATNSRRGRVAKLTDEQAADIRYLCSAGWHRQGIADAYGLHVATVYRIARGETWTHA